MKWIICFSLLLCSRPMTKPSQSGRGIVLRLEVRLWTYFLPYVEVLVWNSCLRNCFLLSWWWSFFIGSCYGASCKWPKRTNYYYGHFCSGNQTRFFRSFALNYIRSFQTRHQKVFFRLKGAVFLRLWLISFVCKFCSQLEAYAWCASGVHTE